MGRDIKRRFTVSLDISTKDAEKQIRATTKNLKAILADMGKASDKMSYFKELSDYLSQIDAELDNFKQKYGEDMFNKMFAGLDTNLQKEIEQVFGTAKSQLTQLEQIRARMTHVKTLGDTDEAKAEMKELEQTAKDLFAAIGKADEINLSGRGGIETRLVKMEEALAKFATVWNGVNAKISQGFNFGGIGFGDGTTDGAPGEKIVSEIDLMIEKLKQKNQELLQAKETFQAILKKFNNSEEISDSYKIDLTESSVQGLISEYDTLQTHLESTKVSSADYYNTLTKLVEVSLKLKKAFRDVKANKDLKDIFMNTSATGSGESNLFGLLSKYANTKNPITPEVDKVVNSRRVESIVNRNNALIDELKSDGNINSMIQKRIDLYDKLKVKLEEYRQESMKEYDTEEEENAGYEKLARIEKEIQTLTGTKRKIEDISIVLENLNNDGATVDVVLKELYKTLGMELPDNFVKRLEALRLEAQKIIEMTSRETSGASTPIRGSADTSGDGSGNNSGPRSRNSGNAITADVDFTSLENTIRSEAANISNTIKTESATIDSTIKAEFAGLDNKLGSILQGELTHGNTGDVQGAMEGIQIAVDKIAANIGANKNSQDSDDLNSNLTDDDLEMIRQENGRLDSKLEVLQELAEQYGSDITQKKRDRYEELNQKEMDEGLTLKESERFDELGDEIDTADQNLQEFEKTYERIILKLSNGKKIEILPNDDGLRKFNKIANEYYQGSYGEAEIDDVTFIRQPNKTIKNSSQTINIDTSELESSLVNTKESIEANTQQVVDSATKLTTSIDALNKTMQQSKTNDSTVSKNTEVEAMKENLLQVFNKVSEHNKRTVQGKPTRQETSAEFFADGSVAFGHGEKGTVEWKTVIEGILSNIVSQSVMSMHSHPWGDFIGTKPGEFYSRDLEFSNDTFSGSRGDLAAWKTLQQYGSKIGAMLTGNIMRTFDVSKIANKYEDFINNLSDIEKQYAQSPEYSKYMVRDYITGEVRLQPQADLAGWHDAMNVFRQMMFEALKKTGFSDTDIGEIYKEYDLTSDKQLTELATTLVNLSSAAQSADSQVEALQNLLMSMGSSKMKDEAVSAAKYMRNVGMGLIPNTKDLDLEYYIAKGQIQRYAGNTYDKEIANIDQLFQSGAYKQAGDELLRIVSQFGKDIESIEGKSALEAFRKGEIGIAEVWNNFGDLTKVSQEAIDKMQTIDSGAEDSTEVQLMSQIVGALSSIDAKVSAIEANTQRTVAEQLDADAQAFLDIYHGGNYESLLNPATSTFDPNNVSEFKARELYDVSNKITSAFYKLLNKISSAALNGEDIKTGDAQQLSALYKQAITSARDALAQIYAYQGRYDTTITDLDTGEVLDENINQMLDNLTQEYSTEIWNLVDILKQARKTLLGNTSYNGQSVQNTDDWDDDWKDADDFEDVADNSDLTARLSNLSDAIEKLIIKLSGDVDITPAGLASSGNVVDGSTEPIDVTSEINQCNDLLSIISRIETAIDQKSEAFEDEKRTVARVIPAEIETLKELGQYLATLKESIEALFTNLVANGNTFEPWKNDLVTIKENIDGVLQNLQEIESVSTRLEHGQDNNVGQNESQPKQDYAHEGTLQEVKGVLSSILSAVQTGSNFEKLTGALNRAAEELKKVATGTSSGDTSDNTSGEDKNETSFSKQKSNQKTAFKQYREELQDVDYLTDELKQDLNNLAISLEQVDNKKSLEKWKDDLAAVKNEVDATRIAFEKMGKQDIAQATGVFNSVSKLGFPDNTSTLTAEQQEILDLRKQLGQEIELYNIAIKNGKQIELDSINATMNALQEKIFAYKEANDFVNSNNKTGKNFGANAVSLATGKYKSIQTTVNSDDFKNSTMLFSMFKSYEASYNRLLAKRKELAQVDGPLTGTQIAEFNQLKTECSQAAKSIEDIIKASNKLRNAPNTDKFSPVGTDFEDNAEGRKAALSDFVEQMYGASVAAEDFRDNYTKCVWVVDNGDGTFTQMTATFDKAKSAIVATSGEVKKATTFLGSLFDEIKGKFRTIFTYLTASLGWQEVFQQMRKGVQYVREIDAALTELKKVTDETDASYDKFLQNMSKTAGVVGSTVKELTSSAADWARLGYSMKEAGELAKNTSILMNVSEFQDVNAATDSMISALQAYKTEGVDVADLSMEIINAYNEVGNNYAISTSDLASSLTRSSAALVAANNSLAESIAMTTAANTTIQDPDSVGNALKVVSMRIRGKLCPSIMKIIVCVTQYKIHSITTI